MEGSMIDADKMKALLGDCAIGSPLLCMEEVDSTNLEIQRRRKAGMGHGLVAVAESQSGGKGRRGRQWVSKPGCNLYFSMLLCPDLPLSETSMLTLVMAMAVCRAVRRQGLPVQIKWPNDVVADGKKICGILTELFLERDGGFYVVIGTGINVNQKEFPDPIKQTATSLLDRLGHPVERETLLAETLRCFAKLYRTFLSAKDLSALRSEYEALLANRGAQVEVMDPQGSFFGIALGIDDRGRLLVQKEDGSIEPVYAGEVSVRGIYGYV